MIIGLGHKSQVGKDTFAKIFRILSINDTLTNKDIATIINFPVGGESKWEIKKFADTLKDVVCLILGCTRSQLEQDDFKKSKLPTEWGDYTYRQVLQFVGTDLLRYQFCNDVWVNALMKFYFPSRNWLISDVRFPNEAEAIKKQGGINIKINRTLAPILYHESELALNNYSFDYEIDNNGTIEDFVEQIKIFKNGILYRI
jgi:hypothetical protein